MPTALRLALLSVAAATTARTNQRWVLEARPAGMLRLEDLRLDEQPIGTLEDGHVRVAVGTLSVDAFIRTMLDEEAYHGAIEMGAVVPAIGVGTVVESTVKKFKVGQRVAGLFGAQQFASVPAAQCMPAPKLPGMSEHAGLGALSVTTGLTAWVGVRAVARKPRRGETVVVSAAAGAVGSIAAQLAKLRGARVIGIAGGAAKAAFLTDTLKLDGAIDYKDPERTVAAQLDALCPDGVDFFFDNVGGEVLDAVLARLRPKARVVVCGAVSQYNGGLNKGGVRGPAEYLKLAERGATMVGYNVMQYIWKFPRAVTPAANRSRRPPRWRVHGPRGALAICTSPHPHPARRPRESPPIPAAQISHLWWLLLRGKLVMHEQLEEGIGAFAPALVKMFNGGHVGKLLVNVA